MKNNFRERLRLVPVTDLLILIIGILGFILATPLFANQFANPKLVRPLDVIWNISLDLELIAVALLVLYILQRLLRKFNYWANKIEKF